MKKILLIFLILLFTQSTFAKKVKFQVNMIGQIISPNGVRRAGNFQGWNPTNSLMSNGGTGTIYSVTLDVPGNTIAEFKFINGNSWTGVETVPTMCQLGSNNNGILNDNRWYYIDSTANDTTLFPAVLFSGTAPINKYAVRVAVNMQLQALNSPGVHIAGNLQPTNLWDPVKTRMVRHNSNNQIFEWIGYLSAGTYEYKFINGNTWGYAESVPSACMSVNNNRSIVVNAHTITPATLFSQCNAYVPPVAPRYNVNFNVDMKNLICSGFDSVVVTGSKLELNNWNPKVKLLNLSGNSIFSKVIQLDSGEINYKYVVFKNGNAVWEGLSNRLISLNSDTTTALNCFGSTNTCPVINTSGYSITFLVDLGNITPDPNQKIYVMGNFNSPSWVDGAIRMKKVDGTANKYAITLKDICRDTFDFIFLNGDSSLSSSREVFLNPANQPCLVNYGFNNYNRRHIKTSSGNITLAYNFRSCPTILPSSLNTSRRVLYESFSSSSLPQNFGQFLTGLSDSINIRFSNTNTFIQYPMNWPGTGDPYYTAEGNSRMNYYNINAIPRTIIDGSFNMLSVFIKNTDTTKLMHLIPSFVKMSTRHTVNNNQITIIDSINPSISFSSSNFKLRTAIVERITKNNQKTSGEKEFFYVVKKMLPDQVISLNNSNVNQVFSRSFTFNGNYRLPLNALSAINVNTEHSVENFSNLLAVSWIQNDSSKEVVQSSWSDESKVVITDSVLCSYDDSISVFAFGGSIILGQQNLGSNQVKLKPTSTTQYVFRSNDGLKIIPFTIYVDDSINITPNVINVNFSTCGINTPFLIGGNTNYSQSKTYSWYLNNTLLANRTLSIDTFRIGGLYKLRVTSNRGCISEQAFNVTKLSSSFNPDFSVNRQAATAPPFDFTFANQTQPLNDYNYFWKWGDGITDSTNNQILFKTYNNNGQYTVKLIAQHKVTGCKDSITKVNYISCSGANPQPLGLTTTKQNPLCGGEATGSITVNGTGGTTPYTYRINGGTYQSSNTFNNLVAGIYTVDVKDAINNVATKKDTLVNPPVVTVGVITGLNNVPVSSTQSYSIAAQSGASYLWSVINGTLLSGNGTTAIQVQWPASIGIGKIIASVNKGNCGATDTLTVAISPQPLGITSTKQNPLCAGEANGSITVNGSGGTAPYTYRINGGTYQTSNAFNNLIAGIYTIDVKDAQNNVVTKKDTLTNPPAITVGGINGLNGVPVSSTQSYSIAAQSGASYSWSVINGTLLSGNGTNAIQVQWPVNSGIGKVNISISKNNCNAFDSLLISIGANPLTALSSKQNESCIGKNDGSISITASGGNPPYMYSLNNGTYQTSNMFNALSGGIYTIRVKDNNQVVVTKFDTITSGVKPTAGIITGPTTVATLAMNNYIVGQQTGVNYLWNITGGVVASGQNTNVVQVAWGSQSMLGKVSVKVTNAGGCSDSSDLNVNVGSVGTNELSISNKVQIYPNPNNGSFAIDVLNSNIEQVDIFNSIGQLIWSYTSNETKQSVLEVRLKTTPGIYTVSVKTESGVVNQKLILTQ